MANTIQKRIKFSKGQIVPELVERTDMDFYDSSAQEMKNVVSSVYGGVRSRRGTKKIDRMLGSMSDATGTATTELGGNTSYIQDKNNNYVSGAIGTNRTIFSIDYGEEKSSGTVVVRGIKFDYEDPVIFVQATPVEGNPGFYSTVLYPNYSVISGGVGVKSTDDIVPEERIAQTESDMYNENVWVLSMPAFSFALNQMGGITSISQINHGLGAFDALYHSSISQPSNYWKIRRNSGERIYSATFYYSTDGNDWVAFSTKNVSETAQDFDFALTEPFRYVRFEIDAPSSEDIGTTLQFQYVGLKTGVYGKTKVKLIDFLYNNEDKYVLCMTSQSIAIYKDDELKYTIAATGLLDTYFDELKWTSKDDTVVFTHKEMPPKILKRKSDGTWEFGTLNIDNIPYTLFGAETKTNYSVAITPSATDGAVRITADSPVFDAIWVGQYIDANGGHIKITEVLSETAVNGITVIPFYTSDKINSWTLITGYEQVWSNARGWPRTCLFAQQRLWFGGSKGKPSTVWASRLGDYFNFKNSGNYDNDAIDVDLLTNEVIVNMIENRGIHIMTSGEEISSPDSGYTPDKITFSTNTRNGSLSTIRPFVIGGNICFIEKNGKSLLNYVYADTQAAYTSDNMSMLSNLINKPVSMAAEINSSKDRGDFLYIVLEDGTMLVGCVVLSQNIMSLSQFKTDGLIKDVCSVGGDTYLLVERENYNYLEKIDDVPTDITTNVSIITQEQEQLYGWTSSVVNIYTKTQTPSVGDVVYDNFGEETGDTISAVSDDTITVNSLVYTRNTSRDKMSDMYISVLSDYNGKRVIVYDDDLTIYLNTLVSSGKVVVNNSMVGTYHVGLPFDYKITGNPIAINHKTTSIKKRITTADIVCKDTPQLEFCGQKKTGHDNYKFFSCTPYGDDVRYTISGEFYKMQILSVQLNINYGE